MKKKSLKYDCNEIFLRYVNMGISNDFEYINAYKTEKLLRNKLQVILQSL